MVEKWYWTLWQCLQCIETKTQHGPAQEKRNCNMLLCWRTHVNTTTAASSKPVTQDRNMHSTSERSLSPCNFFSCIAWNSLSRPLEIKESSIQHQQHNLNTETEMAFNWSEWSGSASSHGVDFNINRWDNSPSSHNETSPSEMSTDVYILCHITLY